VLEVERREHLVVGVVQSAQARPTRHRRQGRHALCQSPARRAGYRRRSMRKDDFDDVPADLARDRFRELA
jgi:hypothetical protein